MAGTVTEQMTDLDMLFDLAKDAEVAAMSYTAAAGLTHDPQLRKAFVRMAAASLEVQGRTIKLLRELGGNA